MRRRRKISSLWKPLPSKPKPDSSLVMCCLKIPPACSYTLRALCSDPKGSLLLLALLALLAVIANRCSHGATATGASATAATPTGAPTTSAATTAPTAISVPLGAVPGKVAHLAAGVALVIAAGRPLARPLALVAGELALQKRPFLILKPGPWRIVLPVRPVRT